MRGARAWVSGTLSLAGTRGAVGGEGSESAVLSDCEDSDGDVLSNCEGSEVDEVSSGRISEVGVFSGGEVSEVGMLITEFVSSVDKLSSVDEFLAVDKLSEDFGVGKLSDVAVWLCTTSFFCC